MNEPLVSIARNGQLLDPVDPHKIPTLLDTGDLLPSDHFYNERSRTWEHLSHWHGLPEEESSSRRRRRSRGKNAKAQHRERIAIGGWIAALFSVALAAGIWAWAENLHNQLKTLETEAIELKKTIAGLKQENLALSEMTPAGRVRCLITYEPGKDQVAILSGVTLGLYKRSDVEDVVKRYANQSATDATSFDNLLQTIKSALPSPIAVTLSDSNGRADLSVPQDGEYVLAASASNGNTQRQYLWLAGFRSNNRPSNVILLGEADAISANNTDIRIKDVSSFAASAP